MKRIIATGKDEMRYDVRRAVDSHRSGESELKTPVAQDVCVMTLKYNMT